MVGCQFFIRGIGRTGWCKCGVTDGTNSKFKQTGVSAEYANYYCTNGNCVNCEYAYRNGFCSYCGTPLSRNGECYQCDGTLNKYR